MEEFTEKFEDITAYSNQELYAPDERWKINQLTFRLKGDIENNISQQRFNIYAKMLQQCHVVENSL